MFAKQFSSFGRNLKNRLQKGGGRDLWGQSARPSSEDLPEWAQEFREYDWSAVPNPQAQKSKQQRRARLLLRLMLASLPISLIACFFALTRSATSSVATGNVASGVPQAKAQAELVTQQWLNAGGLQSGALIWQGFTQSNLPCVAQTPDISITANVTTTTAVSTTTTVAGEIIQCEEHTFRTQLVDDNQWIKIIVTLHPQNGVIAGIHMRTETPPSDKRPTWDNQPSYDTEAKLPPTLMPTALKWATAWATNNQNDLRELAGYEPPPRSTDDPPVFSWFGLPGWVIFPHSEYSQESNSENALVDTPTIALLSTVTNTQQYISTIQFSVARECVSRSAISPESPDITDTSELDIDTIDYQIPRCAECPKPIMQSTSAANTENQANNGDLYIEIADKTMCTAILNITVDLLVKKKEETESEYEPDLLVLQYGAVGTIDPEQVLFPSEQGE